jgi:hypothetical protein
MSTLTSSPIKWLVTRMMCECGGEFEHKFSVKYKDNPFIHVCNKCSAIEEKDAIYPKTEWQVVKCVV